MLVALRHNADEQISVGGVMLEHSDGGESGQPNSIDTYKDSEFLRDCLRVWLATNILLWVANTVVCQR